jgi:hypothetical protein
MKNAALAGLVIAAIIAGYVILKTATGSSGIKAICNDGTVSLSKTNRGTCSKHGGVERWVNE